MHLILTNDSAWHYADSGTFTYNANGIQTGGNTSLFPANTWVSNTLFTDSVGGYGPQFSELGLVWNAGSSSYTNSYLNTFSYVNGYFTNTALYQTWNGSSWANVSMDTNSYNGNNYLLTSIKYTGSSLAPDSEFIYTYDAGNHLMQSVMLVYNGGVWDSVFKLNYSYDANNNNFQIFGFTWSGTAWNTYSLITKSFNAATNQITGSLTQLWSGGTFVNSYEDRYIYDFNNNLTQYSNFTWDNGHTTWVPNLLYTYNYDTHVVDNNPYPIYELDESYNSGTSSYDAHDSFFYTYQEIGLGGINETKNQLTASIYPNPATGNQLSVNLTVTGNSTLTTNIYDVAGRILKTGSCLVINGDNKLNVSLTGIAAGTYYLQLADKTTGKTSVLKFVRE